MHKEMLTIEFRYRDVRDVERGVENITKMVTIGVFDTLEEAVKEGNKALKTLATKFEVRADDKFKVKGLWGLPNRLVTNVGYPTNRIEYFAKIQRLEFDTLEAVIGETFDAYKRTLASIRKK